MTASFTSSPKCASAVSFILRKMSAEISGGESFLPWTSTVARPFEPAVTL